jgi:hypothetical protein
MLILGKTSLYEKQVNSRLSSPVYMEEFARGILKGLHVENDIVCRMVT